TRAVFACWGGRSGSPTRAVFACWGGRSGSPTRAVFACWGGRSTCAPSRLSWEHSKLRPGLLNGGLGRSDKTKGSRAEQVLSCGLPAFQVTMRLLGLIEFVHVCNPQLELSGDNHLEDIAGTLLQLFSRSDVVQQARARKRERPFLHQLDRIHGRHRAA